MGGFARDKSSSSVAEPKEVTASARWTRRGIKPKIVDLAQKMMDAVFDFTKFFLTPLEFSDFHFVAAEPAEGSYELVGVHVPRSNSDQTVNLELKLEVRPRPIGPTASFEIDNFEYLAVAICRIDSSSKNMGTKWQRKRCLDSVGVYGRVLARKKTFAKNANSTSNC